MQLLAFIPIVLIVSGPFLACCGILFMTFKVLSKTKWWNDANKKNLFFYRPLCVFLTLTAAVGAASYVEMGRCTGGHYLLCKAPCPHPPSCRQIILGNLPLELQREVLLPLISALIVAMLLRRGKQDEPPLFLSVTAWWMAFSVCAAAIFHAPIIEL